MNQGNKKSIVLTGTHLTPALELIHQLKNDSKTNWKITYIGRKYNSSVSNKKSIESVVIPKEKVNFYSIPCGKFDRKYLPNTIAGIPNIVSGIIQSRKILKKIKPDVVISFGGYVSVPVIINARFLKIKSITHEQTLTISLTTKINSYFVNKVALSFKESISQKRKVPSSKTVVTGNLLRSDLFKNQKPFIKTEKPIIYITAGNQGSHYINSIIKKIIPEFNQFLFIHQTGDNDFKTFKNLEKKYKNYKAFNYLETKKTAWLFKEADLIIGRSGANTSQEIVAFKQKSILIPLAKSQQNEQNINASWVKEQLSQNTIIISQDKLNKKTLTKAIKNIIKVKKTKDKVSSATNFNLLKLIYEII